jgi:hypothetical protein
MTLNADLIGSMDFQILREDGDLLEVESFEIKESYAHTRMEGVGDEDSVPVVEKERCESLLRNTDKPEESLATSTGTTRCRSSVGTRLFNSESSGFRWINSMNCRRFPLLRKKGPFGAGPTQSPYSSLNSYS